MGTGHLIRIHADAPAKPPVGAPCNGCGVCCLLEPCPLGVLLSGYGILDGFDLGVGVLAAAHPNIRAASAVAMARAMSRSAWAYPSRVAWFDQSAGQIAELPGGDSV